MDLLEEIDKALSAPPATEEEKLAYRLKAVNVADKPLRKMIKKKKPPSIGLAHRLFKTGELLLEARVRRAYLNRDMSLRKRTILLNACKQSEPNDSSKLDHLAIAMGVKKDSSIDSAFTVQAEFEKMGAGWNPTLWLEY